MFDEQFKYQIQVNSKKIYFKNYTKAFKIVVCILLVFSYLIYRVTFKIKNLTCIYDAYHEYTFKQNRNLVTNRTQSAYQGNLNTLTTSGKIFIGGGQLMMDSWIIFIALLWLSNIKNMRIPIAMGMFYLMRGLIFLNIQKFPYPQDIAWKNPGFFSFTVPYDHTRDFYFSGHTGGLTLIFIEVYTLKLIIPGILSFISLIYMMNMLLITRVHYSIDVISGFLFGIWFHRVAEKILFYVDKLFSFFYVLLIWFFKREENNKIIVQQNFKNIYDNKSDKPKSSQLFQQDKN